MPITIDDTDKTDRLLLLEEWRFVPRAVFMRSDAYEALARELRRFMRREVSGRSFLIAAHRGIGKTSLVNRVVENLYREALADAVERPGAPVERPLLVKLHARSLLSSPAPGEISVAPSVRASAPSAEAALQQITIALYRALANEVAACFTRHAREQTAGHPAVRDLPEVAAQLTLDLDLAPELASMRQFWARLGRLDRGVLWPGTVGARLVQEGFSDRGLRELVALTTANQAFQVCVGSVAASRTAQGSAERTAEVDSAGRIEGKDIADRLFGLATGVVLGGTLLPVTGAATAAAAGLGTALFSTLTLGWSTRWRRSSARASDYTFIVDRSLRTLERDLPEVINRVREAGLAPVFLIDELDKLEAPEAAIECIISRLKNLTTDYGFFCFLTDRGYYDAIETKLRLSAYPPEHSFFSHRLLLLYGPADLARYVRELLSCDDAEFVQAWIVTSVVLHRARLNVMDVRRELSRLFDASGQLRPEPAAQVMTTPFLVPMAVQLAIEHTLRREEIHKRSRTDTSFAQLALDVLYFVSRTWEKGELEITIDEVTITADLTTRRGGSTGASAADIQTLTTEALGLARLLTSFTAIRDAIVPSMGTDIWTSRPPYGSNGVSETIKLGALTPLLAGIPGVPDGLLLQDVDKPDRFEFRFDQFGTPHRDWATTLEEFGRGLAAFDGLTDALRPLGLGFGALVGGGVLPVTLQGAEATLAQPGLRQIKAIPALRYVAENVIDLLAGLPGAIGNTKGAIVSIAAIAALASSSLIFDEPALRPERVLEAIDRMLGMQALVSALSAAAPQPAIQALRAGRGNFINTLLSPPMITEPWRAEHWTAQIEKQRARLAAELVQTDERNSQIWRRRVVGWLGQRDGALDPPIELPDIFEAAAGGMPAARMRPNLNAMSVEDWSRLARDAFDRRADQGLAWVFPATLRALGFGVELLTKVEDSLFAAGAPADRAGVLREFVPGADADVAQPPQPNDPPVFAVPIPERDTYIEVVGWLSMHGALGYATRP